MLKKLILTVAVLAAPMALTESKASAGDCYSPYRAPVVRYRAPIHPYGVYGRSSLYRSYYAPVPGIGYGYGYRVPVRSRYAPVGIYGHPLYYGRGSSFGVQRGGVSLRIGF